ELFIFFFSSRRRHTRSKRDWSSDVCSSDLDLLIGFILAAIVKLILYSKSKNAKKFRKGEEYGSARWGNSKDIAPYMDEDYRNNRSEERRVGKECVCRVWT